MIDRTSLEAQRGRNRRDTVLLLLTLAALPLVAGYSAAGEMGAAAALVGITLVLLFNPRNSALMLRAMLRAVPLPFEAAPELWRLHAELCRRAGLEAVPPLFYIPSRSVLALSTGWGRHSAVALSEGALTCFPPRELAAVLAHEIAHVRAGDLKLLRLADAAGHITHLTALGALLLLAVLLPDIAAGRVDINLAALGMIVLAPIACDLLCLRLSRIREFAADAGAAELCGDAAALAAALARLDRGRSPLSPTSWLRTHPTVGERIARLHRLSPPPPWPLVLPVGFWGMHRPFR